MKDLGATLMRLPRAGDLVGGSIGDTYQTLGVLRHAQGRLQGSVRALREALERDPFLAESHSYLARLLAESGREDEALERAHLALRLDPTMTPARWTLARVALLRGERELVEDQLRQSEQRAPDASVSIHFRAMYAMYWDDREMAKRALALASAGPKRAETDRIQRVMRHVLGERALTHDDPEVAAFVPPGHSSSHQHGRAWQTHCDVLASAGAPAEQILDSLERAGHAIVDLAWLDQNPLLAPLRDDPRYAATRAEVAMRVAEMWA